jgi:hypothetical protein
MDTTPDTVVDTDPDMVAGTTAE